MIIFAVIQEKEGPYVKIFPEFSWEKEPDLHIGALVMREDFTSGKTKLSDIASCSMRRSLIR